MIDQVSEHTDMEFIKTKRHCGIENAHWGSCRKN